MATLFFLLIKIIFFYFFTYDHKDLVRLNNFRDTKLTNFPRMDHVYWYRVRNSPCIQSIRKNGGDIRDLFKP